MNVKTLSLVLLGIMFVTFTVLGMAARGPKSTQKTIDAFWIAIIAFNIVLALCLYLFISPLLAVAPLLPAFIFARLFILTRKTPEKKGND